MTEEIFGGVSDGGVILVSRKGHVALDSDEADIEKGKL